MRYGFCAYESDSLSLSNSPADLKELICFSVDKNRKAEKNLGWN